MNPHTYDTEYNRISEEVYRDNKGSWRVGHLRRSYNQSNQVTYTLSLYFKADHDRLPKASPFEYYGQVWFHKMDINERNQLKGKIKNTIGYTPEKETIETIWERALILKEAYRLEDEYYAAQDKKPAAQMLEHLYQVGLQRMKEDSPVIEMRFLNRSLPATEKFLTRTERDFAVEAQKIINGSAFVECNSFRTGHLRKLNERIEKSYENWEQEQKMKKENARDNRLKDALEVDLVFRNLVSLVLKIKQDLRVHSVDVELTHRLYGFTSNLDEYRTKYAKLDKLLQQYELKSYDVHKLLFLGQEYVAGGGMLPPPKSEFKRDPEKIYFGDSVHNGIRNFRVERVGFKYIYMNGGTKERRDRVKHYQRITPLTDPKTLHDYIYNECCRLNNSRFIPEAPNLTIEDVIRKLSNHPNRSNANRNPFCLYYEEQLANEDNKLKQEALRFFLDGMECIVLKKQIESVAALAKLSYQESLSKVKERYDCLINQYDLQFN